MKQKCEWCHSQDGLKAIKVEGTTPFTDNKGNLSFFVCPEHEEKLRRFYDRVRRNVSLFLILIGAEIVIVILSSLVALFLSDNNYLFGYLLAGSFVYLGLVICIFPFCSPATYKLMSVATSLILTRILGGLIVGLGVFALLYG